MSEDRVLAEVFDGQADRFERAPVQSDPALLARVVAFAAVPQGGSILDAGCGPGLVAEAFLEAGHTVHGVDLSGEMIRRARERCARFGDRARFEQGSILTLGAAAPFDASVSRFVLHHAPEPDRFVAAQRAHVRPGGVVLAVDHITDPAPEAAAWHQDIEVARDRSHAHNLTSGQLVDLLARAGLEQLQLAEAPFELDFDEWFDRGTPGRSKDDVRARVLAGRARGFDPVRRPDGGISIRAILALVRGVVAPR
ncbi:MAG TPA: methyltransferase domain-containing protein [Anaeromyxobacteraceae bacterium]|nr:methyltransferase domain-containing protein [Anaeromyxobacteraceae bacterium]